jgi:hypothetical protein
MSAVREPLIYRQEILGWHNNTLPIPERCIMKVTPVLLIILDGFGHRNNGDDNSIHRARKPHWDHYWSSYPHTTINASELHVGLPPEQMGNPIDISTLAPDGSFFRLSHDRVSGQERRAGTNDVFAQAVRVVREGTWLCISSDYCPRRRP